MTSSWISVAKEEPLADSDEVSSGSLGGHGYSRDLIPVISSNARPEWQWRPMGRVIGGLLLLCMAALFILALAALGNLEKESTDTSRIQTLVSENPELQAAYTTNSMPGPPQLEHSAEKEPSVATVAPPPARIESSPARRENTEAGKCAVYRCVDFNPKHSCQCNAECEQFQSCCSDFKYTCLNNVNLPGFRKFLQGK